MVRSAAQARKLEGVALGCISCNSRVVDQREAALRVPIALVVLRLDVVAHLHGIRIQDKKTAIPVLERRYAALVQPSGHVHAG